MKQIAIGMLTVLLLSVLIEPLVEIANVMREKILLGTALTNAGRAARDRSLVYERMRDRDAEIDEALFREYFAEAFEDAMNVSRTTEDDESIAFASNDGKYHPFLVTLDIDTTTDPITGQRTSEVRAKAESTYKFKTKFLRLMHDGMGGADYELTSERLLVVRIRN
ncbi:hypothetical protein MO973_10295 [Paenibacillus sp. TRM 82003]|nr:hypothetical protein [Paenibacillus sp. TRM 82003]